eukprot:2804774-Amphidinium_carterae.1
MAMGTVQLAETEREAFEISSTRMALASRHLQVVLGELLASHLVTYMAAKAASRYDALTLLSSSEAVNSGAA